MQKIPPPNRLEFERQKAITASESAWPHNSQMPPEPAFVLGAPRAIGRVPRSLGSGLVIVTTVGSWPSPKRAAHSNVAGTCRAARARASRSTVAAETIEVAMVASADPMSFGSNDLL